MAVVGYVGGLLLWLGLGLLPYLAVAVPAVHSLLGSIAAGHGVLAGDAERVLSADMMGLAGGPDVVLQYLFSLVNLVMGMLLLLRRFDDRVARLMALALLGTAATFNGPSHAAFHVISPGPLVTVIHFTFHIVSGVAYLWAVVLFPDGELPLRVRSGALRRAGIAAVTAAITVVCWRSSFIAHPPFFVVFFGVFIALSGLAAQTVRLRRPATPEQYQQARLLRSALLPALLAAGAWLLVRAVAVVNDLVGGHGSATALGWDQGLEGWFPAAFVIVPAVLFAGILRYRLWELDVVLNRTLVYGSLTALVSSAYVAGVVLAGRTVTGGPVGVVLVMAAVGLAVAPLRTGLQALANRVVFGQSLSPTEAMSRLAAGLTHLAPAEELRELTRVVVEATRAITSARVWLLVDDRLLSVAQWPDDGEAAEQRLLATGQSREQGALAAVESAAGHRATPLRHQGRLLGLLDTAERRDVPLGPEEQRLLDDLAGHAGLLVHNAQLTAELARHVDRLAEQAAELRRSRRNVVTARDAERRQLERDLHDGAQQDLVAVIIALRALRTASAGPADRGELVRQVDELHALVRSTGQALGELCGSGLPHALLDGGLVKALDAAATSARRTGLDVTVTVDSPAWVPLTLETAVYFCCAEALQNATKHARATRISLSVNTSASDSGAWQALEFAVIDDGVGFDPQAAMHSSGLANMQHRLSAFDGALTVVTRPGAGTCVRGRVPLTPSVPGQAVSREVLR
ncbi:signal transduction histidine kinase [Streptacidiphilus sp. MAP12-16]|uniref:ATP-binding protein n=1 Tax=Streptacidiphilus sp. MAP12-16 TaxID=3156300 RepID=UPI003519798A